MQGQPLPASADAPVGYPVDPSVPNDQPPDELPVAPPVAEYDAEQIAAAAAFGSVGEDGTITVQDPAIEARVTASEPVPPITSV